MTLAAIDSDDRAAQLITLTERLTDRLAEEIRAFEIRRPHLVAAGSAETMRLANIYRHEVLRIRQNPALLSGARPDLTARLVEATSLFQETLARHGRAVSAAKSLTEGLVHAIAKEVATRRGRGAGYGPTARASVGDASAITLNRRA